MTFSLQPIDRLEVIALMDNVSDPFTRSHHGMRWNESQYRKEILKKKSFSGADFCRACNGLSLWIRFSRGNRETVILFDTGPDDGLVVDNAKRMGVDLTKVDAVILSHGHFDHYGGLLSVLDAIGKKDIPVYSHPDLFIPRAFGIKEPSECTYNLTNEDVIEHGGKIFEGRDAIALFDNTILISGEVPRVTSYELGSPTECRKINDNWVPAPKVQEERGLIFNLKNKGLCVFTACGHTGVINAMQHAKRLTNQEHIYLVMGGFHLASPDVAERVTPTLHDFQDLNPEYIVTGHCTGAGVQAALSQIFNERHISYGVGTVFNFA